MTLIWTGSQLLPAWALSPQGWSPSCLWEEEKTGGLQEWVVQGALTSLLHTCTRPELGYLALSAGDTGQCVLPVYPCWKKWNGTQWIHSMFFPQFIFVLIKNAFLSFHLQIKLLLQGNNCVILQLHEHLISPPSWTFHLGSTTWWRARGFLRLQGILGISWIFPPRIPILGSVAWLQFSSKLLGKTSHPLENSVRSRSLKFPLERVRSQDWRIDEESRQSVGPSQAGVKHSPRLWGPQF